MSQPIFQAAKTCQPNSKNGSETMHIYPRALPPLLTTVLSLGLWGALGSAAPDPWPRGHRVLLRHQWGLQFQDPKSEHGV